MRISLPANNLKTELATRGFKHLFHANSVETSITFFRHGAIFSRKYCEDSKIPQSSQWSDKKDKEFDIYNDIFLNFHDLHRNFSSPNDYGPVLFCFNAIKTLNFIIDTCIGLSLTKKQPHKWLKSDAPKDRWRSSISDLFPHPAMSAKARHINGWPDLVISAETLPLDLVDAVVVDKHHTSNTFNNQLQSIFQNCVDGHKLPIKIYQRKFCKLNCACKTNQYIKSKNLECKYEAGNWQSIYGKIA